MPEPISVALVDDDPLVLRLLTNMLTASGIDVAWAAQGADEAVARLGTDAPDVIAVDVLMPGQDGHALTRRLLASFGPLTVVMLTSLDDPDSLSQALAAGAIGYLVKTDPPERIVAGLRPPPRAFARSRRRCRRPPRRAASAPRTRCRPASWRCCAWRPSR